MSEKAGLREDLRSEVGALVASDAPDEEVLDEAVRGPSTRISPTST